MKKTIIIVILLIYIASIAVVNFFGLETKVFDGDTYVDYISIKSVLLHNENTVELMAEAYVGENRDIPLYVFDFIPAPDDDPYTGDDESIVKNPNAVQVNCEVFPHNADNTSVKFEIDEASMDGLVEFHDLSKTFIFLKSNKIVYVTIRATDGSNKSTTIAIWGRAPKE